jgi:hypothetical protein
VKTRKGCQAEAWPCHCGNHWWTKLTKGFVAMVSPQDATLIQDHLWTAKNNRTKTLSHAKRLSKYKTIQLHREILPKVIQIDHKNRNGLDNRRENLRPANAFLNAGNRSKSATAKLASRFKGVRRLKWRISKKPWAAYCGNKYIGTFATEIEAARRL